MMNLTIITIFFMLMSMMALLMFLIMMSSFKLNLMIEMKLFSINSTPISLSISLDPMNTPFMFMIVLITSNILMFSSLYMMFDQNQNQFYKTITLFMLSMITLIMSTNTLLLFVGWDGLGLTSFLLVSHYSNHKAMAGSLITLMTNRIGDATLILTLAFNLNQNHFYFNYDITPSPTVMILLLISATTKSAQVPFTMWLPEAMAAPTPVSALVHSSTLVTAGLFMLMRYYPSLNSSPMSLTLAILGSWTAMLGGMMGVISKDSKKVVAISTLSQLGFISTSLSIGSLPLSLFHLITHASFKALLFLTVGMDIMYTLHTQALTPSQKPKTMNMITTSKLISLLSLNALPFLAGYFSKESILELVETSEKLEPSMALYMATTFTSLYSTRIWKSSKKPFPTMCQSNTNFSRPMYPFMIMSVMSTSLGSMLSYLLWMPLNLPHNLTEHWMPIIMALLGIMMSNLIPHNPPTLNFLTKSMFIIKPPTKHLSYMTLKVSYFINIYSELTLLEAGMPILLKTKITSLSNYLLFLQNIPLPQMMSWAMSMTLTYFLLQSI